MSTESTSDVYAKATDRLRDTLKWLLTSLAAVGAVLLAGLSLSNIGEATGNRLLAVVLGFAIAVVAVLAAAAWCAWVLGVGVQMSIYNLPKDAKATRAVTQDAALMKAVGDAGLDNLGRDLADAVKRQLQAFDDYLADPDNQHKLARLTADNEEVKRLNAVSTAVVRIVAYTEVRRRFMTAGVVVASLGAVAAVGIFAFAWGANPPDNAVAKVPVIVETPTEVSISLTAAGRDRFRELLGASCVDAAIPAVALEDLGAGRFMVAVSLSPTCLDTNLIEIGPADGAVQLPSSE